MFLPRHAGHTENLGELVNNSIDIYWAQSLPQNHSAMCGYLLDLNKLYFQVSGDYMASHKSEQQKIDWLSNGIVSGEVKAPKGKSFAPTPPTSATGAIPIAASSVEQASDTQKAQRKVEPSLGRGGYTGRVPAGQLSLYS
ncbi:hypothetical protein F9L16_24035 [Agarivorans sp. B2Z047]|uniref:hypothetical protein n=1 Tax=Agarivorans sp. B2Z047 TaxID=2652721 RepID=UPI00128D165A|nr:hypothetical protein [Agarivorans sp. B2Z047]MPW32018.1 hypothetical protein [Agarivorans sp. B2Z047]UQN41958.1 hypothetical protein LQZ07_19600 [Agarivorans sp. B2Z047]UQN43757.1 hypothetical protein LQZ07_04610 [Agarivorans sp. B2Z047]